MIPRCWRQIQSGKTKTFLAAVALALLNQVIENDLSYSGQPRAEADDVVCQLLYEIPGVRYNRLIRRLYPQSAKINVGVQANKG